MSEEKQNKNNGKGDKTSTNPIAENDFILIKNRYKVSTSDHLKELDLPHARAFAVIDTKRTEFNMFAYICNPDFPIREKTTNNMVNIKSSGILSFIEMEDVYWPPQRRYCMIVIYERPMGGKVMPSINAKIEPFTDKDVINSLLPAIAETLKDFSFKGITHRSIRPDNLFYMDKEKNKIVIGDCITAPPAYDQPICVETIASGCCMPSGRGNGNISNDYYSLGATLAILIAGSSPANNEKDNELITNKIKQGSFFVLAAHNKLSVAMVELLRGLLTDDSTSRWKYEDLSLWLEGRRATPLHGRIEPNAQRSFSFNGQEYFTIRELAVSFAENWFSSASIIKSKHFQIWVKRGLKNDILSEHLEELISKAEQLGTTDDVFVAQACMLFDPLAPIRYKDISFMANSLGEAFAISLKDSDKLNQVIAALNNELIEYWHEAQGIYNPRATTLDTSKARSFAVLRNFLQQKGLGTGVARCLYELNPVFPCQSELVKRYYVNHPNRLLMAIDKAAKKANKEEELPIDNHIAAFILTHFKRNVDNQFKALNNPNEKTSHAGLLSLYALLQWQYGPKKLPNLISWLGGLIKPIIGSYHSKNIRKKIEKSIPTTIRQGSITDLYTLLDNPAMRENDWKNFLRAKKDYSKIEHYIERVVHEETGNSHMPHIIGQQVAAIISVVICFGGTAIMFIMKLTE
ncbi:MAG: hypothetical protein GY804_05260 [Alphaproteobacteria bacterium]|nr:hypothetical protein [Alphaproteobacteria bacterium]